MKVRAFNNVTGSRAQARITPLALALTAGSAALAIVTAAMLGAAPASANTGAPRSSAESFQAMSTSTNSATSTVIATGAFTTAGTFTGSLAQGGTDTARLPGGTFKITAGKFSGATGFFPGTCLTISQGNGTYKIHDGKGNYARISGSGGFAFNAQSVAVRNASGDCGGTIASELIITLKGPVKL